MMLAAVETVTNADPVRESRRHNSDVAAQATAGESVHAHQRTRFGTARVSLVVPSDTASGAAGALGNGTPRNVSIGRAARTPCSYRAIRK